MSRSNNTKNCQFEMVFHEKCIKIFNMAMVKHGIIGPRIIGNVYE